MEETASYIGCWIRAYTAFWRTFPQPCKVFQPCWCCNWVFKRLFHNSLDSCLRMVLNMVQSINSMSLGPLLHFIYCEVNSGSGPMYSTCHQVAGWPPQEMMPCWGCQCWKIGHSAVAIARFVLVSGSHNELMHNLHLCHHIHFVIEKSKLPDAMFEVLPNQKISLHTVLQECPRKVL